MAEPSFGSSVERRRLLPKYAQTFVAMSKFLRPGMGDSISSVVAAWSSDFNAFHVIDTINPKAC